MNLYEFTKINGLVTDLDVLQEMNGNLGLSGKMSKRQKLSYLKNLNELQNKARETKTKYLKAINDGIIKPEIEISRIESLLIAANKDINFQSIKAARRILEKKFKIIVK